MKSALLIVVLVLMAGGRAEAKKFDLKQLKWALFSAVPAYFTEVLIHEGTHALVAMAEGVKVESMRIFPGRLYGQFTPGYTLVKDDFKSGSQAGIFFIAPQITNALLFSAAEVMFETGALSERSDMGAIAFVFLEAMPLVNFLNSVLGGRVFGEGADTVDIELFQKRTGAPKGLYQGVGLAIGAVGIALLIRRASRIFWKDESPVRKRGKYEFNIAPAPGGLGVGVKF